MCGIFGITPKNNSAFPSERLEEMVKLLFLLSESRGKEASGLAVKTDDSILILKEPKSASKLVKTKVYSKLFKNENIETIIGHARLVTNGSMEDNYNNQPVVKDGIVGIHNGIITNDLALWKKYPNLKRKTEVDTEVMWSLIRLFIQQYTPLQKALAKTFSLIEGSASISILLNDFNIQAIATNTGSVYYSFTDNFFIYASEKIILEKFFKRTGLKEDTIKQLKPGYALLIEPKTCKNSLFKLNSIKLEQKIVKTKDVMSKIKNVSIAHGFKKIITNQITNKWLTEANKFYEHTKENVYHLKRCSKCLLPETMPLITFNHQGVCNYCLNYQKGENRGLEKLEKEIKPYRSHSQKPNCIVSFSGGRDSCYALHYVKNVLKLNPVAYSYDWGMLTDLGRRNQARMCGKLGVEHILVSADILKKRENIKKNVKAWLNKPELGMVPLFMAGDKQYFYYLNKLKREMGIDLVIYADNFLEKTDFKYGFAKVDLESGVKKAYQIGKYNSIKLLFYYLDQFVQNPAYLNSSLIDTFTAYLSSYIVPKDYLYLYRYLKWNEKTINNTLISQYNWELSPDTLSTWRIGDGTASFYNYIYYTLAGFTENDTFRSNQIRENLINRKDALELVAKENQPRWESIKWYCDTIGLNMSETIAKINQAKKILPQK